MNPLTFYVVGVIAGAVLGCVWTAAWFAYREDCDSSEPDNLYDGPH